MYIYIYNICIYIYIYIFVCVCVFVCFFSVGIDKTFTLEGSAVSCCELLSSNMTGLAAPPNTLLTAVRSTVLLDYVRNHKPHTRNQLQSL